MAGFSLKISAAFLAFFGLVTMAVNVPNSEVESVLCNSGIFTGGDPFAVSLDYVLKELESSTATTKQYDFYNISPYPNSFAYGHASCNQNLTTKDCTTCLGAAKTNMLGSCQMSIGGRAVLHDCAIRSVCSSKPTTTTTTTPTSVLFSSVLSLILIALVSLPSLFCIIWV